MKPYIAPIRRCKDGYRVEDYMGRVHEYATIDGVLSKARQLVAPKRAQYVRETRAYHWQVMAPMISSRPKQKMSEGRVTNASR